MERKITERVADAQDALDAIDSRGEKKDNVVDMLANIMHYCMANDIDFSSAIKTSVNHFSEEVNDALDEITEGTRRKSRKVMWLLGEGHNEG